MTNLTVKERKAKSKAKRAHETRWMYYQENHTLRVNSNAYRSLSMEELREFAMKVWEKEARPGRRFPTITATRGLPYLGKLCSYCQGYTIIKLARHHRNLLVLLHELTHALGPSTHGEQFVKRYFPLLWKYAGYDQNFLIGLASEKGYVL